MPHLPQKSSLFDYQTYIKQIGIERGWDKNSHLEIFLLLTEEIGELAKAVRNKTGLYAEQNAAKHTLELEDEFADVLNYIFDLANCFNINLDKAFVQKDKKNAQRIWKNEQ